ncbi:uncharacterized protein [Epargyreus clarus]|uniref:uncharacterized protein n=1 Tax=Epargyreus clarus TaxID=520877 RepID=UPI003C2DB4F1
MTLLAICALVSAQVTFSRDWSGGKRAPPAAFDCSQFARLCRQFVHEFKQAMSTDKLEKHRRADDDSALAYDDDK